MQTFVDGHSKLAVEVGQAVEQLCNRQSSLMADQRGLLHQFAVRQENETRRSTDNVIQQVTAILTNFMQQQQQVRCITTYTPLTVLPSNWSFSFFQSTK